MRKASPIHLIGLVGLHVFNELNKYRDHSISSDIYIHMYLYKWESKIFLDMNILYETKQSFFPIVLWEKRNGTIGGCLRSKISIQCFYSMLEIE